jgi:hypothetical protein
MDGSTSVQDDASERYSHITLTGYNDRQRHELRALIGLPEHPHPKGKEWKHLNNRKHTGIPLPDSPRPGGGDETRYEIPKLAPRKPLQSLPAKQSHLGNKYDERDKEQQDAVDNFLPVRSLEHSFLVLGKVAGSCRRFPERCWRFVAVPIPNEKDRRYKYVPQRLLGD